MKINKAMLLDFDNLCDLGDFNNLSYETNKILAPLNYETTKVPLQNKRIQELKKDSFECPDISIKNNSLLNQRSRQQILEKWKKKRTQLIFKKKKVTCIKKSQYATGFKKRGTNGRFISK